MKKYLIKEIGFHLRMLNDETIDKDDFVNAINEIYETCVGYLKYKELSHDEIINTLDILFYKLDLTKEQLKDKDYLRDQIDNIIDY